MSKTLNAISQFVLLGAFALSAISPVSAQVLAK
jgi:hypothetical protein